MPNRYGLVRSDRREIVGNIVQPYLTAKKDKTLLEQYERIAPAPDGVVRTVLSPVVTETGRLASGESFVDPASTNLQNLSKSQGFKDSLYRVRDCFLAPEGWSFLACDYEKAEAVMVAAHSKDWPFVEKILEGDDIHDWHAEKIWGPDFTKLQRHVGKMTTYASFYIAKVRTITRQINKEAEGFKVTEDQVETIHQELLDLHPLEDWWDRVWEDLMDPSVAGGKRWLENAFGFRRRFYNPNDDDLHKEATNFFAQSGVASAIDRALIRCWDEVDDDLTKFILQVHDELLFLCHNSVLESKARKVKEIMEEPFEVHGRTLYIPVEPQAGRRWEAWRGPDGPDPENEMERMEVLEV